MSSRTTTRRTLKRWLVTVAACLLVFSALAGFKISEIITAIQAQESRPEYFETVEVATTEAVDYVPSVKTIGVTVAPQQVTLRNELPGYVTDVNFTSGALVKQGQVIIQLDVSEQQANLESARARADLAQIVYDRDVELRESNAVSQEAVDRSRAELNVLKAEIGAITSVINRKTIRAPFDGVIGIHQFEPGQYLEPNTVITTVVADSEAMWIDFSVPQFYGELDVGTVIRARLARAQGAVGDAYFEGRIIAGDSFISTGARSRLYRALVTGDHPMLLHNASVEIEVPIGERRNLMAVPTRAVQSNLQGQYVYVLDREESEGDGAYRARPLPVTIEVEKGDTAYVSGELQAEEVIATTGAFKLLPGVLVHAKTRRILSDATWGQ